MHSLTPIPPKKNLGQNFLVDQGITSKIIRAFAPHECETVIEIGPGRGSLTTHLLAHVAQVIAIEFDRDLIALLRERFATAKNFTLIDADALNIDYCQLASGSGALRVIANLPYNISTAILRRLIKHRACITEMVLMLQREVAERIAAPVGSQQRGFLTVLVEAYYEAENLFDVAPAAFRPVPKVWSSVVKLRSRSIGKPGEVDDELFEELVSIGFRQRRKTIYNSFRHAISNHESLSFSTADIESVLEAARIEKSRRGETLTLEEWLRLTEIVRGKK